MSTSISGSDRLDAEERRELPDSAFGIPETHEFPMPDASIPMFPVLVTTFLVIRKPSTFPVTEMASVQPVRQSFTVFSLIIMS